MQNLLTKSYKLLKVSREYKAQDTVIKVGEHQIGGDEVTIIAGPCAVENEETLREIAIKVKASGATMLRGGAFKPRTSPYSFQGLGERGLEILAKVGNNP